MAYAILSQIGRGYHTKARPEIYTTSPLPPSSPFPAHSCTFANPKTLYQHEYYSDYRSALIHLLRPRNEGKPSLPVLILIRDGHKHNGGNGNSDGATNHLCVPGPIWDPYDPEQTTLPLFLVSAIAAAVASAAASAAETVTIKTATAPVAPTPPRTETVSPAPATVPGLVEKVKVDWGRVELEKEKVQLAKERVIGEWLEVEGIG
ncbi:hypothetical protein BDZ91DRAFT_766677 [Kalaharituber pfeilii]|nr:hypothetical protein BDZ91DRAFT_766677 [Kalaharituber pfeilii]